jgi:hypothetical protein
MIGSASRPRRCRGTTAQPATVSASRSPTSARFTGLPAPRPPACPGRTPARAAGDPGPWPARRPSGCRRGRIPRCPYECDFIPYCWRHIPEDSVFDLRGRGVDKFALYYQGIVRLEDVPPDALNAAQRFQLEATLGKRDVTDVPAIGAFLGSLWYPLCHLDFETFDTPIPPFDGTRPYQKIPFQYSLHVERRPGAAPEHFEYLSPPNVDPRRELAERLLAEIPAEACVLTYNQAFEKSVLRDLAAALPDLAASLQTRIEHIRDLMLPFKKRHLYRWPMRGSYSIKEVLPALVPELSYQGLSVADGGMAMLAYHEMCAAQDPERVAQIRRDLLAYCALDTWAMVRILGELRKLVEPCRRDN